MQTRFVAALMGLPLLAALVFIAPGPAAADQTRYITDRLQVTVRTGPDLGNKIIAMATSGEKVAVLETNASGWAKIRLENGKEGWMLDRFLSVEKTAAQRLAELDPQAKGMAGRMEELDQANRALEQELTEARRQAADYRARFEKLTASSAGVIKLRKDHEALRQEYEDQTRQMKELMAENDSLSFAHNLKWFLAGAGVLVVGWFMGLALHRRKKRWSGSSY